MVLAEGDYMEAVNTLGGVAIAASNVRLVQQHGECSGI